jgi:hypothetical protein
MTLYFGPDDFLTGSTRIMGDADDFLSGLGDQDRDDEDDGGDEERDAEGLDVRISVDLCRAARLGCWLYLTGCFEQWARSKKSLALFLVDCSPQMFLKCDIKVSVSCTCSLQICSVQSQNFWF